jgi:hypothetical protein
MAKRIRTIKPEILEDEVVATLPHLDWRLFVSLFVVADDYGNLRGVDAMVRGVAMWGRREETDESIGEAIDRLVELDLLRRYVVRGQTYLHIAGWSKHQKVDRPGKPLVPRETEGESDACGIRESPANHSREKHEEVAGDRDLDLDRDLDQDRPPVSVSVDPVGGIGKLVTQARSTLNEARKRIDPTSIELDPRMGERDLFDRLRETPANLREQHLLHCLSILVARAEQRKSVGDLRLAYLGGIKAWPALLGDTLASIRGRDGPAGRPQKRSPMPPILRPPTTNGSHEP